MVSNSKPKIRNKTGFPLSPLLCNIVLEVLATAIREEKEIKGIQIGKEKLFAGDMILYLENSKEATKKLVEHFSDFSKFAEYKFYIQKSVALIYAKNKLSEREIKETIPFTIT